MTAATSGTHDHAPILPSRLAEPPPALEPTVGDDVAGRVDDGTVRFRAFVATPFRLATTGVLGGALLIALVEWLVFRTAMAVALVGVVLVLAAVAAVVERSRRPARRLQDEPAA